MSDLEKAARALAASYAEIIHDNQDCDTWEDVTEEERERVRQMARACLSALLPPSEEVVEAMRDAPIDEDDSRVTLSRAFAAAINHIISQGKGGE